MPQPGRAERFQHVRVAASSPRPEVEDELLCEEESGGSSRKATKDRCISNGHGFAPDTPPATAGVAVGGSAQVVLIVTCVLVDALAPLLQEQASKSSPGSVMVLAETLSYFLGGLALAMAREGIGGLRRCLQPWRYLAFMPASLAYSWAGFMTYPAIRGFGASQFYLLAQLRVAIIAVFLRVESKVRQPTSVWISLLQLVLGMVVLVWYKASAVAGEAGCQFLPAAALSAPSVAGSSDDADRGATLQDEPVASVSSADTSLLVSFAAMLGVIVTSAFGTIYLEKQLKSSSKDPLFIQLHQLNAVGVTGALLVSMQHGMSGGDGERALKTDFVSSNASLVNPDLEAELEVPLLLPFRVVMSVTCVVARGTLNGSVLKRLDALTKGLIDVTAIVLCTIFQVLAQGRHPDGTAIGLQMLMLLSVLGFVTARESAPATALVSPNSDVPSIALQPSLRSQKSSRAWPWESPVQPVLPKAL